MKSGHIAIDPRPRHGDEIWVRAERGFARFTTMNEARMSKWVVRNDCATQRVGEPRECFDPTAMDGRFDFLSIEEGVQSLIGPDEIVIGSSSSRLVMKGARLVGYIQVSDTSP
jgi:hypothetical protein